VQWPDGSSSTKRKIAVNQQLLIDQSEIKSNAIQKENSKTWFLQQKNSLGYRHQVKNVLDFDRQKLLHFQPSYQGPPLIKGDLNGDGNDDLIIGGGQGQPTQVWIQNTTKGFSQKKIPAFEQNLNTVVSDLALVDLDSDGDLDLFRANAGYHDLKDNSNELVDQVFLNNGKGTFKSKRQKTPFAAEGTAAVAVGDLNKDGYPDILLGGVLYLEVILSATLTNYS